VAVIRGAATPVVDLAELLTGTPGTPTRFVTVRVGDRRVALGVDAVLGVQTIEGDRYAGLPPLLEPARERVTALGAHDGGLLLMLQASRSLLEETARLVDAPGGAS
jgi:purine-binding chemotaxis protein CheW